MNEVIAKSKYNEKAHRQLYFFTIFRRSGTFYFIMAIVVALAVMIFYNTLTSENQDTAFMSYGIIAASLILTPILFVSRINSSIRKDAAQRKDTYEIIEVNKEKLSRKVEGMAKVVIGWHQVEKVYERKDYFFFFVGGDQSLIVEKAAIDVGSSETLIKLVEKYGPKNRKGKPKISKLKVKTDDKH